MTPLPAGFLDRPFAHRALHGPSCPENSREAILAATQAGFGIEIDVQLTADHMAVVFHDYALKRLTGQAGTVQTTDPPTLAGYGLVGGDSGAPTLAEALELIEGRVPLVVEIKDQDGAMGPGIGALEALVARDLAGYGGPVAVMSFNPHSVAAMAELVPQVPRGIVTAPWDSAAWSPMPAARRHELAQVTDYDRVGAAFISHQQDDLRSEAVAEARAKGAAILCWTVRSQAVADQALTIADQITFEGYLPA